MELLFTGNVVLQNIKELKWINSINSYFDSEYRDVKLGIFRSHINEHLTFDLHVLNDFDFLSESV